MPSNDLLTQEEIDALLHKVKEGNLTPGEPEIHSSEAVVPYEFGSQEHITRGPMPALEIIYDRFSRHFNSSLFDLLSRETRADLIAVETVKFADYSAALPPRCSLHIANALTLPGVVLFVLESKLISLFVDGFFGGSTENGLDGSLGELTLSELRISRMLIRAASKDLKLSWEPIYELILDTSTSTNPYFLNIASPTEIIVVARIKIEIGSHQGEIHISMPYSLIEPIKELLETGMHSDRNSKFNHWQEQLTTSLNEVHLEMRANLVETQLSIGDVLILKPGDIIPVDIPEQLSLCAAGIPMFRGAFGVSRGHNSIMVTQAKQGGKPSSSAENQKQST
jgi:flagellar motor switch protein FliM